MSYQYDLTNLTYKVIFYSCILIGAIGFLTNFLNIAISQQSKMQKKTTMGVYNTYMSAFNILTLVFVGFLSNFAQTLGETDLLTRTTLNCKLIPYFSRVFSQCVAWSNVLIAFDRMIMVCIPNRYKGLFLMVKRVSFFF